ncbi:MAG: hypothetical protein IT318_06805 [Anaerolineales bacterium]|nr:hypothetical protein [Anaerolineales bacterium]
MTTPPPPEDDLLAEFRQLGRNLVAAARSAWESDESQKLRQEIKVGLAALEAGLRQASAEVTSGETGQRIKAEVEDFSERVRTGQVESQLRNDLLAALRKVNEELQKATPTEGQPPGRTPR